MIKRFPSIFTGRCLTCCSGRCPSAFLGRGQGTQSRLGTDDATGRLGRYLGAAIRALVCLTGLFVLGMNLSAADIDLSLLPSPVSRSIEFESDILPIFEQSCFRCHGAENPKSDFSLVFRESAIQGGTYGKNILPGDSTNSPLIHFVARLVEDSEMPPSGKGDPLSDEQVAILRAWIDQGASWGNVQPPPRQTIEFTPGFGYYSVHGDDGKFREHHWVNDGWQGGMEKFALREQWDDRTRLAVEGHALRDDYEVTLSLERKQVGFVRAGFEQYRRYYDDSGGYHASFVPSPFDLNKDLSLELGQAWFEAGWNQPGLPKVVAGYEYHYKEGDKSTTQWLPYTSALSGATRNLYPATKSIDEQLHVLRLDVQHTVLGMEWEDNFRYEFYDLETSRASAPLNVLPVSGLGDVVLTGEGQEHQRLVNTLFAQKQVLDWMLVSGGYLYSRMFDGEASFRQSTVDGSGSPASGNYWSGSEITLDHHAHVMNFNAQAGPWQGFTLAAGVMPEWSHQQGFGDVHLDEGLPPLAGTDIRPAVIESDYDRFSLEEHAGLRFTKIPFTVLFADARLQQESISQFESKTGAPGNFDTVVDFARDTDATGFLQDYRTGFHVSPWSRVSLAAHYRYHDKNNDYDHNRDEQPLGFSPGGGYSAFIRELQSETDEVEGKLTLKPLSWLKTSFTYRIEATDYETSTSAAPPFAPGGRLSEAGAYDAQSVGINFVLTPWRFLYFSVSSSVSETRLHAFDNGSQSVVPYKGQTYSVLPNATWILNAKTDLTATYSFSHANYDRNNDAAGLSVGIKYYQHGLLVGLRRQLSKQISSKLQYGFFQYDEPSAGGRNDYEAHGLFGSLAVHFP